MAYNRAMNQIDNEAVTLGPDNKLKVLAMLQIASALREVAEAIARTKR